MGIMWEYTYICVYCYIHHCVNFIKIFNGLVQKKERKKMKKNPFTPFMIGRIYIVKMRVLLKVMFR